MSDSVTPWTIAHQVPLSMEFSRILEWVAISCSIFLKLNINKEGHVGQTTSRLVMSDSETPWTVAHQAPLSMGLCRQEYWVRLPCPPPGDLPDPGLEPTSLVSSALAGGFFTTSATLTHCSLVSVQFSQFSRSVVSDSSRPHGLQPTRLLRPWDFPGKRTGVGRHYRPVYFRLPRWR